MQPRTWDAKPRGMPGGVSLSGLEGSGAEGEVAQGDENRGGNRWKIGGPHLSLCSASLDFK